MGRFRNVWARPGYRNLCTEFAFVLQVPLPEVTGSEHQRLASH